MSLRIEQLSPLMEGFENPTMATLFREMLKISPVPKTNSRGPKTAVATSKDGSCPPQNSNNVPKSVSPSSSSNTEKIAFLKSILSEQKNTADSLMESAKKMGPVAQKLVAEKDAYDAAFESDLLAPIPNTSGTLHGFTLVFFMIALFSLSIVVSIFINQITGSVNKAIYTFIGFLVVFCISLGLISKFG